MSFQVQSCGIGAPPSPSYDAELSSSYLQVCHAYIGQGLRQSLTQTRPGDLARIEANASSNASTKKPKKATAPSDTKAVEGVVYKVHSICTQYLQIGEINGSPRSQTPGS